VDGLFVSNYFNSLYMFNFESGIWRFRDSVNMSWTSLPSEIFVSIKDVVSVDFSCLELVPCVLFSDMMLLFG